MARKMLALGERVKVGMWLEGNKDFCSKHSRVQIHAAVVAATGVDITVHNIKYMLEEMHIPHILRAKGEHGATLVGHNDTPAIALGLLVCINGLYSDPKTFKSVREHLCDIIRRDGGEIPAPLLAHERV